MTNRVCVTNANMYWVPTTCTWNEPFRNNQALLGSASDKKRPQKKDEMGRNIHKNLSGKPVLNFLKTIWNGRVTKVHVQYMYMCVQ